MRTAHTQTSISYPDDILISGDSLEEQTRVKIEFIEFLTLTGWTINPSKGQGLQTTVKSVPQ